MPISIRLTPAEEERLRALAERSGLDAAEWARRVVSEQLRDLDDGSVASGSLIDLLGDYVGYIRGSGEANSEDPGRKFAEHLAAQHREGSL